MKILAINSSPRKNRVSYTEMVMNLTIKGLREGGAEVDVVHLRDKKVKDCIGCFSCWTKTPGVCSLKDDMSKEIYPKWVAADLVIYATPLYHFLMTASMKRVIERTLPVATPTVAAQDGKSYHPLRHEHPSLMFISVAGFPDMWVFNELSNYGKNTFGDTYAGEIFMVSPTATQYPIFKDKTAEIFEAIIQGGRELAESKKITPETMESIHQLIGPQELVSSMFNLLSSSCIAEGVIPYEMDKKGIIPRARDIEEFLVFMQTKFEPDAFKEAKTLQFSFTGEHNGSCHLTIKDRKVTVDMGDAESPDFSLESPFDLWMDVMTKKADGVEMIKGGKCTLKGDESEFIDIMEKVFNWKKAIISQIQPEGLV